MATPDELFVRGALYSILKAREDHLPIRVEPLRDSLHFPTNEFYLWCPLIFPGLKGGRLRVTVTEDPE